MSQTHDRKRRDSKQGRNKLHLWHAQTAWLHFKVFCSSSEPFYDPSTSLDYFAKRDHLRMEWGHPLRGSDVIASHLALYQEISSARQESTNVRLISLSLQAKYIRPQKNRPACTPWRKCPVCRNFHICLVVSWKVQPSGINLLSYFRKEIPSSIEMWF